MCLPITLGENHGSGHFYLAETRTFLLCVDKATAAVEPVEQKKDRVNSGTQLISSLHCAPTISVCTGRALRGSGEMGKECT
jgi:hypothetical protein